MSCKCMGAKKRAGALVLFVLLLAMPVFAYAASEYDGATASAHVHTWDEGEVIKEPSCTEKGAATYSCACGATKTEDIKWLGHNRSKVELAKEPTCTESGKRVYACSRCGKEQGFEMLQPLGHSWGAWATLRQASASEEGLEERACSACGATETQTTSKLASAAPVQNMGRTVYASRTGNKYHYVATCSNMKNPISMTLQEAIDSGRTPCSNCVNDSSDGGESPDPSPSVPGDSNIVRVYRLLNSRSKEHLWTVDANEVKVLSSKHGWIVEADGWNAPASSSKPVYRLHNVKSGEHHYTTDRNEVNVLVSKNIGWRDEGPKFYSDEDGKGLPIYRVWSGTAAIGCHHYTADQNEFNVLVTQRGWHDEHIAWYGTSK